MVTTIDVGEGVSSSRSITSWYYFCNCYGCQPKNNGKTPQIIPCLIGFSIIFTIHFGVFPPIFGNIPISTIRIFRLWNSPFRPNHNPTQLRNGLVWPPYTLTAMTRVARALPVAPGPGLAFRQRLAAQADAALAAGAENPLRVLLEAAPGGDDGMMGWWGHLSFQKIKKKVVVENRVPFFFPKNDL